MTSARGAFTVENAMATFALVGCAKPDITAAGPAYLMCRGHNGFAAIWERATQEADAALILSPEYGLVYPEEVLRPGDVGLGDERWQQNPDAWLTRIQRELLTLRWMDAPHRWLLLGDGDWLVSVANFLRDSGQEVVPSSTERQLNL
jgi:hypothetical protein